MEKRKICISLLVTLLLTLCMFTTVNASNVNDIIGGLFGSSQIQPVQPPGIKANTIMGVVVWVGYMSAIGMIIWVGIKYLMSGAGEKAKAKETIIPIIVGALIITTASTITATVFNVFGYNQ